MTRVIKIGGRAQHHPDLSGALAAAIDRGDRLCIVHGGGDEVTQLQQQLGRVPRFVGGRRVTTREDLDLLRMVLSGRVNKRLVSQLRLAGVHAAGISGEDGALLTATVFDDQAFGMAGTPAAVRIGLLEALWGGGFTPVVSPVATSESGSPLNVNGDDAASAIAIALGADELLLLADVPGVLSADGSLYPCLHPDDALDLIADGTATAGMAAKVEAGCRALAAGVRHVRIGDLPAIADPASGTCITSTPALNRP